MFFRSPTSPLLAAILILVGSMQLFFGWKYGEAAKGEATAIGVITYISGGRSRSYNYEFEVDGVKLQQDSGVCHTAITPQGCEVGAQVLVYYAHIPVLETRLQEFGIARSEKYFMGGWMVGCGLLLICVYFILRKLGRDSSETVESEENGHEREPNVLHIVPDGESPSDSVGI